MVNTPSKTSINTIQNYFHRLTLRLLMSAAAPLLRSWVRIPPGAWIFVCCECRVLSGRGLCDELITRPEESYRLWRVVVCDLETSRIGAPYIYDISSLRVKLTNSDNIYHTAKYFPCWLVCKYFRVT